MISPKLKNAATESKFECILECKEERDWEAKVRAEFIDGSIWESKTAPYKCSELRSLFYQKCEEVEDRLEQALPDEPEEDFEKDMNSAQKNKKSGAKKNKK